MGRKNAPSDAMVSPSGAVVTEELFMRLKQTPAEEGLAHQGWFQKNPGGGDAPQQRPPDAPRSQLCVESGSTVTS